MRRIVCIQVRRCRPSVSPQSSQRIGLAVSSCIYKNRALIGGQMPYESGPIRTRKGLPPLGGRGEIILGNRSHPESQREYGELSPEERDAKARDEQPYPLPCQGDSPRSNLTFRRRCPVPTYVEVTSDRSDQRGNMTARTRSAQGAEDAVAANS